MEFKNLEELKKFVDTQPSTMDLTTPEGIEAQFRNRISNNACIFYACFDVDSNTWSIKTFYCDKNGNAITKEKFESEKGL